MAENYPAGHSEIETSTLDSLRLKVTDTCPWQCTFCHNEGGRFTTDLHWGPKLERVLLSLREVIPGLKEIHYTGGEPTKNKDLEVITAGLVAMGFEVKTTTNGQFSEETMDRLISAGLDSFNFSVHSLDPERFIKFQTGRGKSWTENEKVSGNELLASNIKQVKFERISWAKSQIDRQLEMILAAKEKGVSVKVNTVVSGEEDIPNANDIFNWCREHDVPLRLLPNLGTTDRSVQAIKNFIESLGATEILRQVVKGSSSCSTVYRTPEGYEFVFKQIRNLRLETMCRNCPRINKDTCEEQFYGIRLQEGADGKFYILLCIQESNAQSQMLVEDFLKSPQLKEISDQLI